MPPTITDAGRLHLKWALVDGIGPLLFSRLLVQFGDAEAAMGASASQLEQIKRISQESAGRIARERDTVDIEPEIEAAAEHGVRIICRADEDYPPGLQQIADGPIVLYVKGELRPTDAVAIAVVGTRRCTIYGGEQARRFGELLAGAGFTVVSGLARGIDALAHHGAIEAGGRSIAVMGKGLPEVYPPENQALAEKLLENGAWISELPMRAEVRRENFPSRNRIIAGMTLGTLVIEAPLRSGALITARLASEYNREVFAVPGRAQDPSSFGTNDLIRRGYAKLTMCLEDILDELGEVGEKMRPASTTPTDTAEDAAASDSPEDLAADASPADAAAGTSPADVAAGPRTGRNVASGLRAGRRHQAPPRRSPNLTKIERRVYERVGYEPIFQDAVLSASELPPGEVLAAFTSLELKGLIKRLPGQLVVRTGTA
jgi:DNA processing protein